MELTKDLSGEKLPLSAGASSASLLSAGDHNCEEDKADEVQDSIPNVEIVEKVENLLLERIRDGDQPALFQLGQLYFEHGLHAKAQTYFARAVDKGDYQAMFQLGVLCYDGLAGRTDHKKGFELMMKVATSSNSKVQHLLYAAWYNIGRAYFQGYGIKRSDEQAEKYWLLAADDGNPKASVKAQTALAMLYSIDQEQRDLKKAFFWHSEACGNGSLESQGAMGVMYMHGLGTKQDSESAFICLREAAERGNVYAMGNLIAYYYKRKLFTKTIELASRVATFTDVEQLAQETDCLPAYISKGIALACFYYGRCLHLGSGVKKDDAEAKQFYSKSYQFDPGMCARLQNITTHGEI